MADWFKFYNDGLDAAGLQYCISEQPLVTSVWLVIMSEASKNRAPRFPWDDKDFRLLGYARKINVSPDIFNQCINLLEHAGYIIRKDGFMEVPGWGKLQSDYAKGLDKGYYKNTSKTLASNSEVSSTRREEKRGEEIRGEVPPVVPHYPEVVVEPVFQPKSPLVGMNGVLFFKKIANVFFDRKESTFWNPEEERAMCLILKRESWRSELGEVAYHFKHLKEDRKRFDFPPTMLKLLEGWNGALDKARVAAKSQKAAAVNQDEGVRV